MIKHIDALLLFILLGERGGKIYHQLDLHQQLAIYTGLVTGGINLTCSKISWIKVDPHI